MRVGERIIELPGHVIARGLLPEDGFSAAAAAATPRREDLDRRSLYSPHLWGAGWRLCLECVCEGIGVGSVFIGFCWRLDLGAIIRSAMT